MKTSIHVLTVIFVMNFTLCFAGDPKSTFVRDNIKSDNSSFHTSGLAPATPKEASFNDAEPRPLSEISNLAPVTPKEATFENDDSESDTQYIDPAFLQKIVPTTPREAEFEDISDILMTGINILVPTSPLMAGFEE